MGNVSPWRASAADVSNAIRSQTPGMSAKTPGTGTGGIRDSGTPQVDAAYMYVYCLSRHGQGS